MTTIDLLGYLAAVLTTCSFLPQALLVYRSKNADSISLGMYSVFILGTLSWLAYGVLLGAWPVTVANAVTLSLALWILVMKLRYTRAQAPAST